MDIEFHYYMTYLIAARAGFEPGDALQIATSSQLVDDNCKVYEVLGGDPDPYLTYVSQTMDILQPKRRLMRIYPLFHFVPGDPGAAVARRKDGKQHVLNTTPGSPNAHDVLQRALDDGSTFRIGVAAHAFADSWAHQNFVGYFDAFNAMKGILQAASPNIGHADAGSRPDSPIRTWQDERLVRGAERVDNRTRFLDAAGTLFEELCRFKAPATPLPAVATQRTALLADLGRAIDAKSGSRTRRDRRIGAYRAFARRPEYGGAPLPVYEKNAWREAAVVPVPPDRRGSPRTRTALGTFTLPVRWRHPDGFGDTPWFRFQEAVKAHQNEAWALLQPRCFQQLELARL